MNGREKCGFNGKEMFPTKDEARKALRDWAHAKGSRRVFRCEFCNSYHLTKGQRGPRKGSK